MYAIACAFRRGVSLLGKSFGYCSPRRGTPFQVQGVYKEMTLRRGRDYEGGRCVALILLLCKRIIIKFFWDYSLNIWVCNYGKRVVIRLLRAVIK